MISSKVKEFGSIVASRFIERSKLVVLIQRLIGDSVLWYK